jgi:hypothetical protein
MGTVTFWRNRLGFIPIEQLLLSLLCEVILFTEVQNLSSVAVSQCSIVPWGSGLTPVSLILLLQLMREVLSDPSKMKKTTEEFGYNVLHDDTFCTKISYHDDYVLKQSLIL